MPSRLFDLTGRVALVTGSSRGIGLAIATEMALSGAKVMLSSIDEAEGLAATAQLRDQGLVVDFEPVDVGVDADLDRLAVSTRTRLGPIDILVCNAGINQTPAGALDIPEAEYDLVYRINLRSSVELCRRVVPQMAKRHNGSVILISSLSGLRGNQKLGAYSLSKAALAQLARNLAVEYGPSNVRCNAISPGLIDTHFSAAMMVNPEIVGPRLAKTPLRRAGTAREIAGAAVFLASDAGAFTTGHNLVVDGGTLITD